MDTRTLLQEFKWLPEDEQQAFYDLVRKTLFPEKYDVQSLTPSLREARYPNKIRCPHCNAIKVKRNGTYKGRQRYLCQSKRCGRTFNDYSGSPIDGTHYPDKWMEFLTYMVDGKSCRYVAKALDIHISTAFRWRHSLLYALRKLEKDTLEGIVEMDETYFLHSRKGQKGVPFPRTGKSKSKYRGLSHEQVAVLVAIDRHGKIITEIAGRGNTSAEDVGKVIDGHLAPDAILCTDGAKNYTSYAKINKLKHEQLKPSVGRIKMGIYHIQHVNSFHNELKLWLKTFRGVSTKYLNNYLIWFRFTRVYKDLELHASKNRMLQNSFKSLQVR